MEMLRKSSTASVETVSSTLLYCFVPARFSLLGGDLADQRLVRFLVLANARTGSYMLVQALNSHSKVTCFSELFNAEMDHVDFVDFNVAGYSNDDAELRALRDSDFKRFLRERIFSGLPEGTRACGFKLLYSHVWGFPGLLEHLIEDTDLRIVHLKRGNLLRVLVSTKIAERTGVWQMDRGFAPEQLRSFDIWKRAVTRPTRAIAAFRRWLRPPPSPAAHQPVTLPLDVCREFFFRARHEEQHFDGLFQHHSIHELSYEDVVGDRDAVLGDVQSFLGVEPKHLTVTLQRQNPEPLSELIANYDEIRREFKGTPAEAFFD